MGVPSVVPVYDYGSSLLSSDLWSGEFPSKIRSMTKKCRFWILVCDDVCFLLIPCLWPRTLLLNKLTFRAVFRIHDILGWIRIRIRGSMPLTNGSGCGSGSFYAYHWPLRCQQKTNLKKKVFLYNTFLRYLFIIFKDKKSKRCHKTVEIKVFLTIFAYW